MSALEPARRGAGRFVRATLMRVRAPGGVSEPPVEVIDVDLVDALARAERAETEVARLQVELAAKDEILREARKALLTARLALRDQLRMRK